LEQTLFQYDQIVKECANTFLNKTKDYGTAWRILRLPSLTDQIYIKASRIRTIENKGEQKIGDSVSSEFIGIINYSILAIIQMRLPEDAPLELSHNQVEDWYYSTFKEAKNLMVNKNHDYGEIWRDMRISSMTDLILMKILRIKQIEDHDGLTIISEGADANYFDIVNYAVFALIKLMD
jgi:hypothetical protein